MDEILQANSTPANPMIIRRKPKRERHYTLARELRKRLCVLISGGALGENPDKYQPPARPIVTALRGANKPRPDYSTLLRLVCHDGYADVAKALLEAGADPNRGSIVGAPASARRSTGTPLRAAAASGSTACVELLLDHGADPDARDQIGHTALHRAATGGHTKVAQTLLKHGADPLATDDYGTTPLGVPSAPKPAKLKAALREAARPQLEKQRGSAIQFRKTPKGVSSGPVSAFLREHGGSGLDCSVIAARADIKVVAKAFSGLHKSIRHDEDVVGRVVPQGGDFYVIAGWKGSGWSVIYWYMFQQQKHAAADAKKLSRQLKTRTVELSVGPSLGLGATTYDSGKKLSYEEWSADYPLERSANSDRKVEAQLFADVDRWAKNQKLHVPYAERVADGYRCGATFFGLKKQDVRRVDIVVDAEDEGV